MRSESHQQSAAPHAVPIPSPTELAARVDWSDWYLTDEADMGESPEQTAIIAMMLSALRVWFEERGWTRTFASGDHFFGWIEDEPLVRISPDVYVCFDFDPPTPLPRSWQTWRAGHPIPAFAMEVVSADWRKDYESAPRKYAQLGVDEFVVFDPHAPDASGAEERFVFQRWRHRNGMFVRDHAGGGPLWSDTLEVWLHAVNGLPGYRRLCRLGRDEAGTNLVPTEREQRDALSRHAETEARRAETEARRAETEARARRAVEVRLAEVEAELRRLREQE